MDESRHLVKFKRTARTFEHVESLRAELARLAATLDSLVPPERRAHYGLLQDMRDAPMVANAEMDAMLTEYAPRFSAQWKKVAILIRTPIGKLQARRKAVNYQGQFVIFEDEIEALNFLTNG